MDININQYISVDKTITYYHQNHWMIKELILLIENKYDYLFHAVIVHGSFATDELLKFSDFDGLLIINDDYIDSSELASFKKESMRLIYKFDPLQHHGWFEISKSELNNYPQNYLPHEILDFAKCIYPRTSSFVLNIYFNNLKVDYEASLRHIIKLLEKQILIDWEKERLYMLKSYLSKVMLLPSLYYSKKYSEGIFKKESFNKIKSDFTSEEWEAIDIATEIRENWDPKFNLLQKLIMKRSNKIFRKLTKFWISPKIDSDLAQLMNNEFKVSLSNFINAIKFKLK